LISKQLLNNTIMSNLAKFKINIFLFLICTNPIWSQITDPATPKVVEPIVELPEISVDIDNPEIKAITKTLNDYLEGTSNGEPERLKRAFHKDLNLYSVNSDTLRTWSGKGYISNFKPGEKHNRIGKIISIDYENDAAVAKIEILMPGNKRVYTDYMLMLKVEGAWKIIHKSFTSRPEAE